MATQKVLIGGEWLSSNASGTFQAEDPKAGVAIPDDYPISSWAECVAALESASCAYEAMRTLPRETISKFLELFADRIEANSPQICEMASRETALPVEPRLASGELPRTTGQLRQAANAARTGDWARATIDTESNIRSCLGSIGPVAVFGPNNFPLAFGSISGGDFAAAIAAGNPVIAKANSMHPGTTRLLAEQAQIAASETGMPPGSVQLIYRMSHDDGEKLAKDPRLAAIGYTGSRHAGLKLKAAADSAGKPIYLELSSVNPVVILNGALTERGNEIAEEFSTSCLMGTGQFCTNPGLVILESGELATKFVESMCVKFNEAAVGTLLSKSGQEGLVTAIATLTKAGAKQLCGGESGGGEGYCFRNTLLEVSGADFLANSDELQTEAFGNASMFVVCDNSEEMVNVVKSLEGNLTGCIYSHRDGIDDATYDFIAPALRQVVGRLLNDKMPTGVAVTAAMNHGGPYPATGHPGFTAVGMPGAITRFSMLQCYDNVRPHRLPDILRDENPTNAWRCVDGEWKR